MKSDLSEIVTVSELILVLFQPNMAESHFFPPRDCLGNCSRLNEKLTIIKKSYSIHEVVKWVVKLLAKT